jgi:hypothetical protein
VEGRDAIEFQSTNKSVCTGITQLHAKTIQYFREKSHLKCMQHRTNIDTNPRRRSKKSQTKQIADNTTTHSSE